MNERLLKLFDVFDPEHVETIFGREVLLNLPDPQIPLAPIKRVAILTEAFLPKVDGVSKTAYLVMKYLRQTGREVVVLAPDISPTSIDQVPIYPLRSLGVPNVPETRMALPTWEGYQVLNDFKPDLIHLFSPALMSVSGVLMARMLNIPVVANYQTDLPGYAREYIKGYGGVIGGAMINAWLKQLHNRCHVTLSPSKTVSDDLHKKGYKRLRPWGRGVDGERFNPQYRSEAWRERLLAGRDPDSLICIYVGRVATEKRIDLLLEVAKTEGVALTIIGDGAQRQQLEELFEGTGTHFLGYLMGDELPAAFASADVFMFTGAYETFGQVVQEAMASGLASVVTDQGAVKDLVVEGETGFVVESNAQAFKDAVIKLRDNPALRQQMGQNAREIAEQRPWERILSQLETYYMDAIRVNDRYKRVFVDADPILLLKH